MKRNILLDIDGVLADFYRGFGSFLNENYNAELNLEVEPSVYSMHEWGPKMDFIDTETASDEWIEDNGFVRIPPYEGAADFVRKLNNLGNVHIVTARIGDYEHEFPDQTKDKIKSDTYAWFRLHNIPTNGKIRFAHEKVKLCKEENISILIEDKLSTALHAAKENIHAILMDHGWNQHPERYRIYRAHTYEQILDIVRRLV